MVYSIVVDYSKKPPAEEGFYGIADARKYAIGILKNNPAVRHVPILTPLDKEWAGTVYRYYPTPTAKIAKGYMWSSIYDEEWKLNANGTLGRRLRNRGFRSWHTTSPCSRAAGRRSVHSGPYPRPVRRQSSGSIGSRMPWAATSAPLWRSTERA